MIKGTDLPPTSAELARWARLLREAADLLAIVPPNVPQSAGSAYTAAKSYVDQVADEMYGVNDALAREAWEQVTGLHVDLPISGKRAAS